MADDHLRRAQGRGGIRRVLRPCRWNVPERGLASQDAQEIAGDHRPLNALEGSIGRPYDEVPRLVDRRGLEYAAVQLAVVDELRGRDAAAHARVHLRQSFLDDHDAIRVAVGQRPDQDAVDDREDRTVDADAQREAENHGDGKNGRAAQLPKGEGDVADDGVESVAHGFLPCPIVWRRSRLEPRCGIGEARAPWSSSRSGSYETI